MIDVILDFIFNNLFIVIIIIAIVSNLFGSSKKGRTRNENRESNHSDPTTKPESLEAKIERNLKKFENIFDEEVFEEKVPEPASEKKPLTSIEEQRKKQQEALANRFQTSTLTKDPSEEVSTSLPTVINHRKKSSVNKKNLKKRVTQRGLQESIIMAEVLGKPRALKPYNPKRRD